MSNSARRRTRPGTVFAAIVLALITLALAVVLFAPQVVGLQRAIFVAQAISFRGPIVIGATILLLLILIAIAASRGARRLLGGVAVVLTLFVVASVVLVGSRGIGNPSLPEASDDDIRVLSWNTRGDEPGSPAIAQLALEVDADVIALPETTEAMGVEIANQMSEAGSPMWVHTRTIDDEYKATATTLLISPELGDYVVVTDEGDTGTLPSVVAKPLGGDGPTIVAAHPVAPTPSNMNTWRSDLDWLGGQCSGNVVIAGDFNATIDHVAGLAAEGPGSDGTGYDLGECTDGARATGNGAVGTWTTGLPPLLGAQIDHVMASSNWSFSGFEVITAEDRSGSDHRPIVAQLSPAESAA